MTNATKFSICQPLIPALKFQIASISAKVKSPPPVRSGNILRNENGQFSFSCGYCGVVKNDCREMMNHINTHFNDKGELKTFVAHPTLKYHHQPPLEFVSCTNDDVMQPPISKTFRESTNKVLDKATTCTKTLVKPEPAPPLQKRLLPKLNVEHLVSSRPCIIKRVKTMDETIDATPIKSPTTLPGKFKPIRIPPLPAAFFKIQNSKPTRVAPAPRWGFGKNYEIIYQKTDETDNNSNATVNLIALNGFDKIDVACNPEILKCNQCKLEPAVGESDPREHKCRECRKLFPNHTTFETHFYDAHRHPTARCYQCEMEPAISNETDPRRHKCVICEEWLTNHVEFRTHLIDAHDEYVKDNDFNCFANDYKEFNCYICEKTLKQREYLLCHMKGHFDKYLEHMCDLCGGRFRSENALNSHIKLHDTIPTECDLCNKIFPNSLRMRNHRMCHTSELNHVCPLCGKGFKLSKYLKRHMAVHNEVKIGCRYCDATFSFSTGRRAHEKSVHNVL